jgi:hypothetical protein
MLVITGIAGSAFLAAWSRREIPGVIPLYALFRQAIPNKVTEFSRLTGKRA